MSDEIKPVSISYVPGAYLSVAAVTGEPHRRNWNPRSVIRGIRFEAHNNAGGYFNWVLHYLAFEPQWAFARRFMPIGMLMWIAAREAENENDMMCGIHKTRQSRRNSRWLAKHASW